MNGSPQVMTTLRDPVAQMVSAYVNTKSGTIATIEPVKTSSDSCVIQKSRLELACV